MATTPSSSNAPRVAVPKLQMALVPRNDEDFGLSSEIRDRLLRRALYFAGEKVPACTSSSSLTELSAPPTTTTVSSSSTFPSAPTPRGGSRSELGPSRSTSSSSFSTSSISSEASESDAPDPNESQATAALMLRRLARKPIVKPKGMRLARSGDPTRTSGILPLNAKQGGGGGSRHSDDDSNSENSIDGEVDSPASTTTTTTAAAATSTRKFVGRFSLRRTESGKRSASARFTVQDLPRLRQEKTGGEGSSAQHNQRAPIVLESSTSSFVEEEQCIEYPEGEFDASTQAAPLVLEPTSEFYQESAAAVSSRTIVSKTPGLRWFPRYFMSHPYYLGVGKHSFLGILVVMYLKISSDSIRTIYMNQMGVECRILDSRFLEQHKLNTLLLTKTAKREWQARLLRKISPSLAGADCDFRPHVPRLAAIEERVLSLTTMHPSEMLRLDVFKFGVISYSDDLLEQHALLLNDEVSPAFNQFLLLLGQAHPTSDTERYRGGLTPAEGSVFLSTCYGRFEIAFHVAQWLKPCDTYSLSQVIEPEEERERLYLLRKRHIGNDSVVVVFHEGSKPFDPTLIKTQYTQVYIVIQQQQQPDPLALPNYRISICAKDGVQPWFPAVPEFTWYPGNENFRALLLDKLIGAQQSCYISPLFQKRFVKSRTLLLEEIWDTVVSSSSKAAR